jgi:eukaryotic-like serine/threonine-protein kinase
MLTAEMIGPYRVLGKLGEGGMGEVYRARDTKLNRDVAIKILPPAFANDPDRLARFRREAQVLASLNHPNIAAIYGFEDSGSVHALVLELVEGETLADRLAGKSRSQRDSGPGLKSKVEGLRTATGLPIDEALAIARQIIDALEAAHEQGIIHRDLKPANIKVRDDGTVKVLDFGLAKLAEAGGAGRAEGAGRAAAAGLNTQSPTITTPAMTAAGMILGTAAYMSPEQAKGRPADKRSDIWAFGCVLYEMLTGKRAFDGEDVSDTLANILKSEPDWSSLPQDTPVSLRRLLERCLEKTRNRRLADIADARHDFDDTSATTGAAASPVAGTRLAERFAWVGAVLLAIAAGYVVASRSNKTIEPGEVRFEIETPVTVERQSIALSPDGGRIVFVANSPGVRKLWIRALDSTSARPIDRTDDARYPFWSPKSDKVGFFAQGKLKVLTVSTGDIQVVINAPRGLGGTWNSDNVVVFAPTFGGPLQRTSLTGSTSDVTKLSGSSVRHASPRFLPDGRHFLFYADGSDADRGVYIGQLNDPSARRVVQNADAAAEFATAGYLLYPRGGALVAQPFDPVGLRVTGDPVQVAESIDFDVQQSATALSAATNGTFIYRSRTDAGNGARLAWFDRDGRETERADRLADANANGFAVSHDQKRVAISRGLQRGIWLMDLARPMIEPLLAAGNQPVWSRDDSQIAFSAPKNSRILDLVVARADGNGSDDLLLATSQNKTASDWSPSGDVLLFRSIDPVSRSDLWAMPMHGEHKPWVVLKTDADERDAQFSPDGQWIVYESDRSGRSEIWLQRFGKPGPARMISSGGGTQVRWRKDGREIFYVRQDGTLMVVAVENLPADPSVEPSVGTPSQLFPIPVLSGGPGLQQYTPSLDGQRFLVNVNRERPEPISVVLHWKGLAANSAGVTSEK